MADNNIKLGVLRGCPKCDLARLIKYGKTARGRQKYRCIGCGHQFVAGSKHLVHPDVKVIILRLLAAGILPRDIAQAFDATPWEFSVRWIYGLRRKMRLNDKRHG